MKQPGVEGEPEGGEPGEPFAEITVAVEALRRAGAIDRQARILMPSRAVADAFEPASRDRNVLLEDAFGARADAQIDIADDAGATTCRPVFARRAHRRDAVDKFGLAERLLLLRPVGPVHLPAFLEAGRDDVVPAADIFEQIL